MGHVCGTPVASNRSKWLQVTETHSGTERIGVVDGPGPALRTYVCGGNTQSRIWALWESWGSMCPLCLSGLPPPLCICFLLLSTANQPLLLALSDRCHVGWALSDNSYGVPALTHGPYLNGKRKTGRPQESQNSLPKLHQPSAAPQHIHLRRGRGQDLGK